MKDDANNEFPKSMCKVCHAFPLTKTITSFQHMHSTFSRDTLKRDFFNQRTNFSVVNLSDILLLIRPMCRNAPSLCVGQLNMIFPITISVSIPISCSKNKGVPLVNCDDPLSLSHFMETTITFVWTCMKPCICKRTF